MMHVRNLHPLFHVYGIPYPFCALGISINNLQQKSKQHAMQNYLNITMYLPEKKDPFLQK